MKSLPVIVVLVILFVILHSAAIYFYFYWTVWWYDILMHVLGGFITALIVVSLLPLHFNSKTAVFLATLVASIAAGILWEYYEYKYGITFTTEATYVFDTTSDLLNDIVGGLMAYLLLYPRQNSTLHE